MKAAQFEILGTAVHVEGAASAYGVVRRTSRNAVTARVNKGRCIMKFSPVGGEGGKTS